jgi:hypothetical protein
MVMYTFNDNHDLYVSCRFVKMADAEDIQPLVCDNGTGMVKVSQLHLHALIIWTQVLFFYYY